MTSPSDVLALARAVNLYAKSDELTGQPCICGSAHLQPHKPDCPVPIAQRVISEEEGK